MLSNEDDRIAHGAAPRDLSSYSRWREDAGPGVEAAFSFYGCYMAGQTNGLSDALSLSAYGVACALEDVPQDVRAWLWKLCQQIHTQAVKIARQREGK